MSALLRDMKLINPDIGCLGIHSHSRAVSQEGLLSLLTREGPEKLLGTPEAFGPSYSPFLLPFQPPLGKHCLRLAVVSHFFLSFSFCVLRQMFSHHTDSLLPARENVQLRGLLHWGMWSVVKHI